jgi:hypothetical protein
MTTILCVSLASDPLFMHGLRLAADPGSALCRRHPMFVQWMREMWSGKVRCYLVELNFLRFVVLITPVDTVDNPAHRRIMAF